MPLVLDLTAAALFVLLLVAGILAARVAAPRFSGSATWLILCHALVTFVSIDLLAATTVCLNGWIEADDYSDGFGDACQNLPDMLRIASGQTQIWLSVSTPFGMGIIGAAMLSVLWSLCTLGVLHIGRGCMGPLSSLYFCRAIIDALVAAIPLLIVTAKGDPLHPTEMLVMATVGAMLPLMLAAAYSYCLSLIIRHKIVAEDVARLIAQSGEAHSATPYQKV